MLKNFTDAPAAERIIVAFDCPLDKTLALADELAGKASWAKVGMMLYYVVGPSVVSMLKKRGFKVFLDLKFHDIPHQVEGAARAAAASGADMLTMHATGGIAMMLAARRGAEQGARDNGSEMPATLAITVLTSMDDASLALTGTTRSLEEQVMALSLVAQEAGVSGVVASPQEAESLRDRLGERALIVTPGVRPRGSAHDDQSRVATPAEAFANGASHIVVGRPITQAADPAAAFDAIADEVGR